jgi:hypothetical protein
VVTEFPFSKASRCFRAIAKSLFPIETAETGS